ncbi:MAG: thiosulfohydrolase SoxB [Acidiferrobacterales bacterium]|jgi:sulfur-oxidizing protein SoxB|nr:thiosulfohydrolase SoxB [Acidiferrobacterales bacterium]
MSLSRREFLQMLAVATAAGFPIGKGANAFAKESDMYDVPKYGNVSLLHFTDCHAQLLPIYFREPNINIGVGEAKGRPPHIVGEHLLKYYGIKPGSIEAHAFTYLDFEEACRKYGKVGGFAHLASLVNKVRASRPGSLLLDSGDTWQGSATSLWTRGQDMIDAQKLLGVDVMTGHWEFTYGAERVKEVIAKDLKGHIDFVAQNVNDATWGDRIFKPYVIKNINGVPVAIIGQAFPYTPIANPRYLFPEWSFGIKDNGMQEMVDKARAEGAQVCVALSHNGADVDIKMASRVHGLDVILGGHTHDAVPQPIKVKNSGGTTLVINSGSNGKFLSVLDLNVRNKKVVGFKYKLLPVFSNLLPADKKMQAHIDNVRRPYEKKLGEKLAVTESVLYRRGNFNGTFDQMILDAMMEVQDAEIAFSPGFRWGTSLLPGDPITMDRLMDQTAITYATSTLNHLSGNQIKVILEDIADNLFNEDPYYQQGGDMVRVGGLKYSIRPTAKIGSRIGDMTLNGDPIDPDKKYKVAGWASIQVQPEGKPQIWDTVSEYLRNKKTIRINEPNVPKIVGLGGNPGYEKV